MTLPELLLSPERRLVFWRSVCGCHAGALAVLVALGWVVVQLVHGAELNLTSAIRGAGVVLGAGLAAKLAAILAARALLVVDRALVARRAGQALPDERISA